MSEISGTTTESLSDEDITAALIAAYEASDLMVEVMTADIPVMGPNPRYRNMLGNAQLRYRKALEELSTSAELLTISDSIHVGRCGCTPAVPKEGCDWHVVGKPSTSRSRILLQAGELKINGFTPEDIIEAPVHVGKYIDYLEAPREDRPRLLAELQQFFAEN